MKKHTLLVTGSRSISNPRIVAYVLCQVVHDLGGRVDELLHGDAAGVDKLAGQWAHTQQIRVRTMRPDLATYPYRVYGSRAYHARDRAMVEQATHVVAIWDGKSRGTKLTLEYARSRDKLHSVWRQHEVEEELGMDKDFL